MRRAQPPRGRNRRARNKTSPREGRFRRRRTNTRCAAAYGASRQELFRFSVLSCGQVISIAVYIDSVRPVAAIASLVLACLGGFITAVLSLMVVTATDGAGGSDHLYFAGSHDVHCRHQTTVLGHEVIDVSGFIDEAVVDVLTNAVLNVRVLTLECLHEGEQNHFLHGDATLDDFHHSDQELERRQRSFARAEVLRLWEGR